MSLKGFHVVLISLSSLLAFGFGGWSIRSFVVTGSVAGLLMGVFSLAAGVGLIFYIMWFVRRVRSREEEERRRRKLIRPLALPVIVWFLSTRTAGACPVCYGEAEGPLIDAARLGVWLLFGLVFAVQVAFVLFFVHLHRRAKQYREARPHPTLGRPTMKES